MHIAARYVLRTFFYLSCTMTGTCCRLHVACCLLQSSVLQCCCELPHHDRQLLQAVGCTSVLRRVREGSCTRFAAYRWMEGPDVVLMCCAIGGQQLVMVTSVLEGSAGMEAACMARGVDDVY
jgi:hypothetical protein